MSIFSHFAFRRQHQRSVLGQGRSGRRVAGARLRLNLERLEDRALPSGNVISGYVFNDLNNDGLLDPRESGIANVPLELRNAAGVAIANAVTDANGFYQFKVDNTINTAPMTLQRSAAVPSTPSDWTKPLSIAQFDPALGTLTAVDIMNAASIISQIKLENLDSAPATITATVSGSLTLSGAGFHSLVTNSTSSKTFNAAPFDGTIDFDDPSGHDFGPQTAAGSTTFTVTAPSDLAHFIGTGSIALTEVAHATSAGSGAGNLFAQINTTAAAQVSVIYHYLPSNSLRPGSYTIMQTSQPAGFLDGKLSSNGTVIPDSIGKHSIVVTLGTSDLSHNDFAEIVPASVAGFVYLDMDDNGVKDPSESGITGVAVALTGTSDLGQLVHLSQTTRSDGSYQFLNARPGTYAISETQAAGYLPGKEVVGTAGGTAGDHQFSAIALAAGVAGTDYDFGELLPPNPTSMIVADSFAFPADFAHPLDVAILSKLQFLSFNNTLDPNVMAQATFVDGLYRHVLGRPAEATSLLGWVQQLQSGLSRAQVVDAIWNSAEHRGLEVDRLYATFLHRSADAAGRAGWVNALLAGAGEMDMARALIASTEFQTVHADNASYVAALYAAILGRAPSGAEMSSWVTALQNGVSRDSLAVAFLDSSESFQLMANCAYTNLLHRPADPAGNQAWRGQLLSGRVTPAMVCKSFLASDEFFALSRKSSMP